MERITYNKTLDAHKSGVQFTLQGFETADKVSRRVVISLMQSGDAIDLPEEQMVAVVYINTPSAKEPSINECTIQNNTIAFDVIPIVEEGVTEVQIKLIEITPEGASAVLAMPKFAIEVTKSNMDDEPVKQTTTYTALEEAIARAKATYESRLLRIALDENFMFCAYYADGTVYESNVLRETFLKGDALLAQSFARGDTGVRDGEETDNAKYYSNVARSSVLETTELKENADSIFVEVQKHGVYTNFSVDFETGEVLYFSPQYKFKVNLETGDLEAIGKVYDIEGNLISLVSDWLGAYGITLPKFKETVDEHTKKIEDLEGISALHTKELKELPTLREHSGKIRMVNEQENTKGAYQQAFTLDEALLCPKDAITGRGWAISPNTKYLCAVKQNGDGSYYLSIYQTETMKKKSSGSFSHRNFSDYVAGVYMDDDFGVVDIGRDFGPPYPHKFVFFKYDIDCTVTIVDCLPIVAALQQTNDSEISIGTAKYRAGKTNGKYFWFSIKDRLVRLNKENLADVAFFDKDGVASYFPELDQAGVSKSFKTYLKCYQDGNDGVYLLYLYTRPDSNLFSARSGIVVRHMDAAVSNVETLYEFETDFHTDDSTLVFSGDKVLLAVEGGSRLILYDGEDQRILKSNVSGGTEGVGFLEAYDSHIYSLGFCIGIDGTPISTDRLFPGYGIDKDGYPFFSKPVEVIAKPIGKGYVTNFKAGAAYYPLCVKFKWGVFVDES